MTAASLVSVAFGAAPRGRLEATTWLRTSLNGDMAARAWQRHASPGLTVVDTRMTSSQPPDRITYDLEEALELLAALEDALEVVAQSDYLGVVAEVEPKSPDSIVNLASIILWR